MPSFAIGSGRALTTPGGAVAIEWQPANQNGAMRLIWKERNDRSSCRRRGAASVTPCRMAASLGSEVTFEFPPEGVRWALAIDAAHIVR